MKSRRNRRRPFPVGEIGLAHHINIPGSSENRDRLYSEGEAVTIRLRSGEVKVEEVVISGVVGGEEEAEDLMGVAGGAGDEVGK